MARDQKAECEQAVKDGYESWGKRNLQDSICTFHHPEHGLQCGKISRYRWTGFVLNRIPDYKVRIVGQSGKHIDVQLVDANVQVRDSWEIAKQIQKGTYVNEELKEVKGDPLWTNGGE